MRTHLQEPCGAGDVTLGRQCGKPSDAQFDSGRLLQLRQYLRNYALERPVSPTYLSPIVR
jgi:hypothetical protein